VKSKLQVADHRLLADTQAVEVWTDTEFVAAVYGRDGGGVRIVSKYPLTITQVGPDIAGLNVVEIAVGSDG
jgi:hypothetical protein